MEPGYINLTDEYSELCEKYYHIPIFVSDELFNTLKLASDEGDYSLATWINTLLFQIAKSQPDYVFRCGWFSFRVTKTRLPDEILLRSDITPIRSDNTREYAVFVKKIHPDELPKHGEHWAGRCPHCKKYSMYSLARGGRATCECRCGYTRIGKQVYLKTIN